MITADDIMRDADVAKLAGLKVETFQRKMKRGFKPGELDWKAADPVSNGRERLWFRKDVERVWRERIRVAATGAPVRRASLCEALERGPWTYRPAAHKNDWRGDFGQPRVVLIGPKARAILAGIWGEADTGTLFSPAISIVEWMRTKRAARKSAFYPCRDEQFSRARPDAKKPGDTWDTCAYNRAIGRAAERAGVEHWAANQLRHSFATEVRRKFGLEACRAVLGHSMGAAVTDRYSYAAIEDEIIAKAREAVEALG